MTSARKEIIELASKHIDAIEKKTGNGEYADDARWRDSMENQRLLIILCRSLVEKQDEVVIAETQCRFTRLPDIDKRIELLELERNKRNRIINKYILPVMVYVCGSVITAILIEKFVR